MDNDTAKAAPSRRWTAFWLAVFGAGLLLTCFSVLMPLLDLLAQDLTGRTDALRYPDLWRAALVAGVLSALLWLCCVGGLLFASELREFRSWWFTFTLVPLTQGMALGMAHPDGFIANMVLFMVLALLWAGAERAAGALRPQPARALGKCRPRRRRRRHADRTRRNAVAAGPRDLASVRHTGLGALRRRFHIHRRYGAVATVDRVKNQTQHNAGAGWRRRGQFR